MDFDPEPTSLSFEQFVGVLRRRVTWVLLCCVIVAGVAYGYSKHKTKMYTATAALAFNSSELDKQIVGLPAGSSLTIQAQQAINLELVEVGETAANTARLLGHGLTARAVSASVSARGKGESSIIDVSSTSTSPRLAAAIANTYTSQFVKEHQHANRQFFKAALALVTKQLARLPPAQRFGTDGLDLQNRAHTLGLLAGLGYNDVQVAQEAVVPVSPSSPKTKTNTMLGAVLGLLLGLGVAFLLERFDRRIRTTEELVGLYHLPVLGVVPNSAALSRAARRDGGRRERLALQPAEVEAFSLIRARMRFFNVDHDVSTVMIASPSPGDGKTTIARHLSEAAARLGSRVLLMEADLRQPTLAQQLDIQSGPGLTGVLTGAIAMGQATQSVAVRVLPGEGANDERRLDVLVAGAVPPNPGELLESRGMSTVLEQAKRAYDLVLIDTPPLTAVSDGLSLLMRVDGVVVVGRIGRSRRDAAEQLLQMLSGSGAPLLGVIANCTKSGGPAPYPGTGRSSPTAASANGAVASEELVPTAKT